MNQNEHKDFDRDIRNKLEGYHPEVPAGLWDKIQSELDQHPVDTPVSTQAIPAPAVQSSKTKTNRWINWSIAAAILIFMSIALLYNRDQETVYLRNDQAIQLANADAPWPADESNSLLAENSKPEDANEGLKEFNRFLARMIEPRKQKTSPTKPEEIALNEAQHTIPESDLEPIEFQALQPINSALSVAAITESEFQPLATDLTQQYSQAEQPTPSESDKSSGRKEGFGVSRILNLVVAQVDKRSEKFVSFSDDEEGNLKIDFNLAQHRNSNRNINK